MSQSMSALLEASSLPRVGAGVTMAEKAEVLKLRCSTIPHGHERMALAAKDA